MTLNTIVSVGIILVLIIAVIVYLIGRKEGERVADERFLSLDNLAAATVEYINAYTGANLLGLNLTRREYLAQEEQRKEVARQVMRCCSGNEGARETTKSLIRQYLVKNVPMDVLTSLYDTNPGTAPAEELAEIIIYKLDPKDYGGLKKFFDEHDSLIVKRSVTEEDIRSIYRSYGFHLSDQDIIELVTTYIYKRKFGLGAVDTYNYQLGIVEEIQMGLSGPGSEGLVYRDRLKNIGANLRTAKDSIHLSIHGEMVAMPFLRFASDNEMRRVISNMIKDTDCGELTKAEPFKITESVDGRRLTASRPSASDAWFALIRKFDTVYKTELSALYKNCPDGDTMLRILNKLVYADGSIVITGEMKAGKTVFMRAFACELPGEDSIRTVENDSFELNLRKYMPERNITALRTTKTLTESDILSLLKKTSADKILVGELTNYDVMKMFLDMSKICSQIITTGHQDSSEMLIADLVNANINHGFSNERLAEIDVVQCLNFNIHLVCRDRVRLVDRIEEIVIDEEVEKNFAEAGNEVEALENVRRQLGRIKTYKVIPICKFNWDTGKYEIYNDISPKLEERYELNRKRYGLPIDKDLTKSFVAGESVNNEEETEQQLSSDDVKICPITE